MQGTSGKNTDAWQLMEMLASGQTLTQASDRLGLELSAASKMLRRLEDKLGFGLFEPNTRPKVLSAAALELLPAVIRYNAAGADLHSRINKLRRDTEQTIIRLSVATGSLNRVKMEGLQQYETDHPEVSIEVQVDYGEDAVLDGRLDAAVVSHEIRDRRLTVVSLGKCFNLPLASPRYLERFGTPHSPHELPGHQLILTERKTLPLTDNLFKGDRKFHLPTMSESLDIPSGLKPPKMITAGYYPSLLMTLEGRGIAVDLALGYTKEHLRRGELVPVIDGWHRAPWNKSLIYRPESLSDRRLAAFLRWYAAFEPESSHREWQYWYSYFGFPAETAR